MIENLFRDHPQNPFAFLLDRTNGIKPAPDVAVLAQWTRQNKQKTVVVESLCNPLS